jgi:hypothetical protein
LDNYGIEEMKEIIAGKKEINWRGSNWRKKEREIDNLRTKREK